MIIAALAFGLGASEPLFHGRDLDGWHMDVPELDADPDGPKPSFRA
jgi:hypothetical protein